MKKLLSIIPLLGLFPMMLHAERAVTTLNKGWEFSKGRPDASTKWQQVSVPHDWAIYGPFDRSHDLQKVAVKQNGETVETMKTGRTGGLPFIGQGTYRTSFEVPDTAGRTITLIFDGAMSNARVKVNGKEVAYWPYGYNSFYADVTDAITPGSNDMVVELENYERASRWYPGAGLYRNVHVVNTDRVHIPTWGTFVTTPYVSQEKASVRLEMEIAGAHKGEKIDVITKIFSPDGKEVAINNAPYVAHGQKHFQNFIVDNPQLWSPETPNLYTA
ncbi:MAG: beta-galactosidase, partial [Muribaculaceae bacterium]|nr:beta-galactosidase [Muribaculaceae bacterium]